MKQAQPFVAEENRLGWNPSPSGSVVIGKAHGNQITLSPAYLSIYIMIRIFAKYSENFCIRIVYVFSEYEISLSFILLPDFTTLWTRIFGFASSLSAKPLLIRGWSLWSRSRFLVAVVWRPRLIPAFSCIPARIRVH